MSINREGFKQVLNFKYNYYYYCVCEIYITC